MKIFWFTLKKKKKSLSDKLLESEILKQSISITWRCSPFELPVGGTVPAYNQKELTVQLQRQPMARALSRPPSVTLCHRKVDQTPLWGYFRDIQVSLIRTKSSRSWYLCLFPMQLPLAKRGNRRLKDSSAVQ